MQKLHNYEIIFLHQALLQTGNPKKSHHQEQHELLLKVGPAAEKRKKKYPYQLQHFFTRIATTTLYYREKDPNSNRVDDKLKDTNL